MKRIFRIALFALASVGLFSCNDTLVGDGAAQNGMQTDGDGGYAVFRIGTTGNETRADIGDFVEGSENEFAICDEPEANAAFFYSADGSYLSVSYLKEIEAADGSDDIHSNTEAEKAYKVYVKQSKSVRYCLLVLNGNPEYLKTLKGVPMAEMKNVIDGQCLGWKDGNKTYFTMTNTVYVDGDIIRTETAIDPTQICRTVEEAASNPVIIHVERVLAKFTLTYANADIEKVGIITPKEDVEKLTFFDYQTELGSLVFKSDVEWNVYIQGWGVNATETETYLFKNLGDVASNGWKYGNWGRESEGLGWNDITRLRSYWAVDPHYQGEEAIDYPEQYRNAEGVVSAKDADDNTYTKTKAGLPLKYYSFNELSNAAPQKYAVENTFAHEWLTNTNFNRASTHIIVAAVLLTGGETNPDKAKTIYNYNKVYWYAEDGKEGYDDMPEALKGYMIKQIVARWEAANGAIYTDNEGKTKLSADNAADFVVAPADVKNGDGRVMLTCSKTLYDKDGNAVSAVEFEKYLKEYGTARRYDHGRMYYTIPVKHWKSLASNDGKYAVGSYGVVRNHWYKTNISAINSLGIPVDNPDQPIIPNDDPDKDGNAAFEIVIIPWHVVQWVINF